jgi:NDP-sugar pyrophosphorylase family protein
MMKAVIMAGGKGTRLKELTNGEIPKPLVPVNGKPILQHQIERLCENSVVEFCIITGYLGVKIREFFGDGSKFGVRITYYAENEPLGSAGALGEIPDFIENKDFLLVFGDTVFDIDIARMERFHREKRSRATLFVHPNSHPFDSDLVVLDSTSRVVRFDNKHNARDCYSNIVNAGLYILSPEAIPDAAGKLDLEQGLLPGLVGQGCVYGYRSTEYIKDVGTVERIRQSERD